MQTLDSRVINDITHLLNSNLTQWRAEATQSGIDNANDYENDEYMQLTIATNDDGTAWNYQTGDNSYTGNCYLLPHWAVVYIGPDSQTDELLTDIVAELESLLTGNR